MSRLFKFQSLCLSYCPYSLKIHVMLHLNFVIISIEPISVLTRDARWLRLGFAVRDARVVPTSLLSCFYAELRCTNEVYPALTELRAAVQHWCANSAGVSWHNSWLSWFVGQQWWYESSRARLRLSCVVSVEPRDGGGALVAESGFTNSKVRTVLRLMVPAPLRSKKHCCFRSWWSCNYRSIDGRRF